MDKLELTPTEMLHLFICFINDANSSYKLNLELMNKEEMKTQDFLHLLELGELSYRERSKIATQLAENRKIRRQYKNKVEELEPIVEFFANSQNKDFLNRLSKLLGQVRKVENYHNNRRYVPKVLSEEPIITTKSSLKVV